MYVLREPPVIFTLFHFPSSLLTLVAIAGYTHKNSLGSKLIQCVQHNTDSRLG